MLLLGHARTTATATLCPRPKALRSQSSSVYCGHSIAVQQQILHLFVRHLFITPGRDWDKKYPLRVGAGINYMIADVSKEAGHTHTHARARAHTQT